MHEKSISEALDSLWRSGLGAIIFTLILSAGGIIFRLSLSSLRRYIDTIKKGLDETLDNMKEAQKMEREFRYDVLERHENKISDLYDRSTVNCKANVELKEKVEDYKEMQEKLCEEKHKKIIME